MVEYLDPAIAGEGLSANDFNPETWTPALEAPRIPTEELYAKAVATAADKTKREMKQYFPKLSGRPYRHQPFPCWLYHPKEGAREIKDLYGRNSDGEVAIVKKAAQVAKELGVTFRETTMEERAIGFPSHRWEWTKETLWRPTPYEVKFDPKRPGTGKTVVTGKESNSADQVAAIVAAVLAQVTPPAAPSPNASDADWAEFQAFKAWKNSQPPESVPASASALAQTDERAIALAQAKELGLDIHHRSSLETILAKIKEAQGG